MRKRCQRRVERLFVSAEVVMIIDGSCLYSNEVAGAQQRSSVMLGHEFEPDHCNLDPINVLGQLASSMFYERRERLSLFRICAIIDDKHRLGWIRVGIRVAQSCFCA